MVHPMMPEQLLLEEEIRSVTRHRYFKLHEKAEEREDLADTHVGRNVFDHVFAEFLASLEKWYEEKLSGKVGRRSRVAVMLKEFGDTPTVAYIFTKHLINSTLTLQTRDKNKAARQTRVALATTQAIHDELRMRYFEDNRKALLKRIVQDFQQRDLPRRRRRELMIKQFNTQQLEWQAVGWGTVRASAAGHPTLGYLQAIHRYDRGSRRLGEQEKHQLHRFHSGGHRYTT